MEEDRIKSYFKQQARSIVQRSTFQPDGCLAYFIGREVKDEAVLGLLAVSSSMSDELRAAFPTPVEALAVLSGSSRSEICQEFRRELQACLRQIPVA